MVLVGPFQLRLFHESKPEAQAGMPTQHQATGSLLLSDRQG